MDFVTLDDDDFTYGAADVVVDGVRRVIAENPSKFTYRGTGTYIIGSGDVAVIDPGPLLDAHRDALLDALEGQRVRAILVTHCHADHSPLAAWLKEQTGAPTIAFGPHGAATEEWDIGSLPEDFGRPDPDDEEQRRKDETGSDTESGGADADEPKMEESTDVDFVPDEVVVTGDEVFSFGRLRMRAIHTPGHTSNHTCFTLDDGETRSIFTGDHVMGWSTTVVSPPDGDMNAYIESLRLVAGRNDHVALPTHGAPVPDPSDFVRQLVEHRLDRERQVLEAVRSGLHSIPAMVTDLYAAVRTELHRPAGHSVLGHLVKLVADGRVEADGGGRPRLDATYRAI
jgi:glyoxylase-like metal-dependent hydrolase (beta-lactamase superfamily II)